MCKVFYDTDCLSCFLWVEREDIIFKLWDKVYISNKVYDELKSPFVPFLNQKIDKLIKNKKVEIVDIETGSKEEQLYRKLTNKNNQKIIGKGEASTISLVVNNGGTMASNNLKDI